MTYQRKEIIGDCTLYLGDCRDILPTLWGGEYDVVTDPPYGISADADMHKKGGRKAGLASKREYRATDWDSAPIDAELMKRVVCAGRHAIVFGGNYYAMPPAKCWLVWDKVNGTTQFADAELAWTNLNKPVRILHHLWNGFTRKDREVRFDHPTQKPVGVMKWCIGHLPQPRRAVLDPFMGSGTTGVAACEMGAAFVGIERYPQYFDLACHRIAAAISEQQNQAPLALNDNSSWGGASQVSLFEGPPE